MLLLYHFYIFVNFFHLINQQKFLLFKVTYSSYYFVLAHFFVYLPVPPKIVISLYSGCNRDVNILLSLFWMLKQYKECSSSKYIHP